MEVVFLVPAREIGVDACDDRRRPVGPVEWMPLRMDDVGDGAMTIACTLANRHQSVTDFDAAINQRRAAFARGVDLPRSGLPA